MNMEHYAHLNEGPPQTGTDGGFVPEPTEDLGSNRVINKTSKQDVQPEVLVKKTTKFMFFKDCSIFVSYNIIVLCISVSGGGL